MPLDSGCTAPTHSRAVMAASTAEPFFLKISADISEQIVESVATAPAHTQQDKTQLFERKTE